MAEQDSGTVIGADTVIKGEMTVENRARILGRFEGTITARGMLEVASKAVCKANVETGTIQVDGTVQGNITAKEKAQLNGTAQVVGDLVASKLVVTEGAAFKGQVHVGPDAIKGGPSQPSQPKAPPAPQKR
jgi:cytoskeletal protein CcmA (bactofilin family)